MSQSHAASSTRNDTFVLNFEMFFRVCARMSFREENTPPLARAGLPKPECAPTKAYILDKNAGCRELDRRPAELTRESGRSEQGRTLGCFCVCVFFRAPVRLTVNHASSFHSVGAV